MQAVSVRAAQVRDPSILMKSGCNAGVMSDEGRDNAGNVGAKGEIAGNLGKDSQYTDK